MATQNTTPKTPKEELHALRKMRKDHKATSVEFRENIPLDAKEYTEALFQKHLCDAKYEVIQAIIYIEKANFLFSRFKAGAVSEENINYVNAFLKNYLPGWQICFYLRSLNIIEIYVVDDNEKNSD